MDITKRLLALDPTLQIHNEGEWSKGSTEYSAFNDAGVECEVGEYLYSLVRILKPSFVLETGTHWGIGASYMGMGCKDNNNGLVTTIEFLPEIYKRADDRFKKLGLDMYIRNLMLNVMDFNPGMRTYQLILLDTEPQTRFAELEKFYPALDPGGYVFIHDLHRHMHQIENKEHGFAWPFGPITDFMKNKVKIGELIPFHFGTPRGLTGFYKVHPDDYVWL
jgi:predicted O-methyltransferase YrrM